MAGFSASTRHWNSDTLLTTDLKVTFKIIFLDSAFYGIFWESFFAGVDVRCDWCACISRLLKLFEVANDDIDQSKMVMLEFGNPQFKQVPE